MTATLAHLAVTDMHALENNLELLGLPYISITQLEIDEMADLWSLIEQVSPEEREAFAAFIGSDLRAVTEETLTKFRQAYVGSYPSYTSFVQAYARARWITPMEEADSMAAAGSNFAQLAQYIDADRLSDALFSAHRNPYFYVIGPNVDHIFATPTTQPAEPRVSF